MRDHKAKVRHPSQRQTRIKDFIQEQADALAMFAFTFLIALLALVLAPNPTWDYGFLNGTNKDFAADSPEIDDLELVYVPSSKEIDLNLPFKEFDEAALEQEPAGEQSLPAGWLAYTIERNDTLDAILRKITKDEEARRYLVTQKMTSYRKLRRGKRIEYLLNDTGQLTALRYKVSPELHMSFERDVATGAMKVSEGAPSLTATTVVRSAEITSDTNSLFAASDDANVPDAIIQKVINALETRIDFVRDTRLGDNFTIVYEILRDEDNEYAGPGELLGLQFVNQGETIRGLLNQADGGYYTPTGESLQRAFLRSPLKFSRISSQYTLRRYHPVLKKWRAHRGVDFAAATNTPVRSSADGTIDFIGKKGGYGNVIMIKHFGKYLTVYGHLNKFAKGLKRGAKVTQAQLIGYVGSTGLATGPHLHYEFLINGKHVDPLSVQIPVIRPNLEATELASFSETTSAINSLLEQST